MTSKKCLVLSVDQDQIVIPKELIPENVTMFGYELQGDGRIILTPLSTMSDPHPEKKDDGLAKVIDIRRRQAKEECRHQKSKKGVSRQKALPSLKQNQSLEKSAVFVKLHLFSSRLEAEMRGEILRQSDIPYLIQSEDIGLFGPGAAPAPGGARIVVRKSDFDDARQLLAGLI